jgi:3-hydroxyacyl-[acyl-carrier-protein] dehydratase
MAPGSATLHLRADEPAAEGHFPGNPIIPGAVLLREILQILAPDGAATHCEIRSARFFRPVRPGDRLTLRWDDLPADACSFTCTTDPGDERVLSGSLRLRAR